MFSFFLYLLTRCHRVILTQLSHVFCHMLSSVLTLSDNILPQNRVTFETAAVCFPLKSSVERAGRWEIGMSGTREGGRSYLPSLRCSSLGCVRAACVLQGLRGCPRCGGNAPRGRSTHPRTFLQKKPTGVAVERMCLKYEGVTYRTYAICRPSCTSTVGTII